MPKINKTTNSSRSYSKKNNKPSLFKRIFGSHTRLILILATFSIVGMVILIRSSASQLDISYNPNDIIAGDYSYKPTTASRNLETNVVTYQSHSNYELLLANGTIVCDDGNTAGVARTGYIPKKKLERLMSELEKTGINDVPEEQSVPPTTTDIGNTDVTILNKGKNSKVVKTQRNKAKPTAADKLQKAIAKACREDASSSQQRDTAPKPTVPVRGKRTEAKESMTTKIANVVSPKVEASATTAVGSVSYNYANLMADYTQFGRRLSSVPDLTRSNCLDTAARIHAEKMMNSGSIYHSSLTESIKFCDTVGSWTNIGENVGKAVQAADVLTRAYMDSPGHKANILSTNFKCHGHGVWTRKSDGMNFHVALFARFSNGRCN